MPSKSSTLRAITGDNREAKGPVAAVPNPPQASIEAATLVGVRAPTDRGGTQRFLSDVIVEMGLASRQQVDTAIEAARVNGETPEAMLVRSGTLSPDGLSQALAERYGLDYVDLATFNIDMAAANLVSS